MSRQLTVGSSNVDSSGLVDTMVGDFKSCFPRGSRPSSRAAFLFGYGGEPLERATFEASLDATNDLLSSTRGPWFAGESFSAADVAWAPFLERWAAQLPCLHAGLNVRDASRWPALVAWFDAIERQRNLQACGFDVWPDRILLAGGRGGKRGSRRRTADIARRYHHSVAF